ncbi:MAG: type V CRISPR-associated endonuclease Cas1 [Dissulfurispiraceae bacterium]|jgi:CRISPR-associated protein Cas1|nr:type V CRISPR-associated endonuclease Cas1 [Dissulfurispiraceae bacterium]
MMSLPDFREKNIVICFASEGQKVSFKNDNLVIKDAEEQIVLQTTCHKIFSLWLAGNISLTSGILEKSKKFGFSIYMLSNSCRPYGLWSSATEGNFVLRKKQYDYSELDIARHLVNNKIFNQTELLRSIRNKQNITKTAIGQMLKYAEMAVEAEDLHQLLGIEGVSSRLFFSNWFVDMPWTGRKPRAKMDIINTTLDIGYTYLFNFVECLLNLYGFDLYKGVYHQSFYQRKSLVCDIVEPFRCIIDKQVKRAYGLKQLQPDDFRQQKGQFFLKIEKNKDYTRWLIQNILEHKEYIFSYVQDYYRCFMRDKTIDQYPVFRIKD